MSYQIDIPHFYCLEYSEGNKTMMVDIDFRDPVKYLNINLIDKWKPPHDGIVLDKSYKEAIIRNIYDYLVNVRELKNVELEI